MALLSAVDSGLSAADFVTLGTIVSAIVAATVMLIKAGPAWSKSVIQASRDEVKALSESLVAERAGRQEAEEDRRKAEERAARYYYQLIKNGLEPEAPDA